MTISLGLSCSFSLLCVSIVKFYQCMCLCVSVCVCERERERERERKREKAAFPCGFEGGMWDAVLLLWFLYVTCYVCIYICSSAIWSID